VDTETRRAVTRHCHRTKPRTKPKAVEMIAWPTEMTDKGQATPSSIPKGKLIMLKKIAPRVQESSGGRKALSTLRQTKWQIEVVGKPACPKRASSQRIHAMSSQSPNKGRKEIGEHEECHTTLGHPRKLRLRRA